MATAREFPFAQILLVLAGMAAVAGAIPARRTPGEIYYFGIAAIGLAVVMMVLRDTPRIARYNALARTPRGLLTSLLAAAVGAWLVTTTVLSAA